ncbi:MAG: sensor histidine kinase [Candidatus Krumholzibacteria bacterium]|nr:sensor histidine kinase [Candidatus Krumholzibacteria bacterium]
MRDDLLHKLQERVKELTALHGTARILQDQTKSATNVMQEVAALMPSAWQYPEVAAARIRFERLEAETSGFRETDWRQTASFVVRGGQSGEIEICYLEPRPLADEGPFLKEERDLIESLAEMLRFYFQRLLADEDLLRAHSELEQTVAARTAELRETNASLRRLASELSLTEARERRKIAEDLHDHIGQALAFIKMSLEQFRGNAIFCGFEGKIDEITTLIDQTIKYTRNLTFEISPPALYELGLEAAIDGLAERFRKKHGLAVNVEAFPEIGPLGSDVVVLLYKAVQELLTNVAKHARANRCDIRIKREGDSIRVEVEDDGCGFDAGSLASCGAGDHFGLFNIRERIQYLGGVTEIRSAAGKGTAVMLTTPRRT